jgi:hypothetical protein
MKIRKSILGLIIATIAISLFLVIFYGKTIVNCNKVLFSSTGDGMKNYYTYAYYIKDNHGWTNFEGMNYPYGENFMYTDCHPIQAFFLKILVKAFPGLSAYTIGILNLFMLLSLIITTCLLYLIFVRLRINFLLAVLGSVAITVLSPQIFRVEGHLALSYGFFVPWIIYLILLIEAGTRQKLKFFILISSLLLFFMTHAYLGMIATTLVFIFGLIGLIKRIGKSDRISVIRYMRYLWSAIISVLLFFIFVKIIDTHVGRTTNPWGIFESYADFNTVFLPEMGILNKLKDYLFPGIKQTWEGWAYIGLLTIVSILFYIIVSIKSCVKERKITLNKQWIDNSSLRKLFFASFFILALAMFFPFRMGLQWIIGYIDIIKQFRALGRFAWVFYFISTIVLIFITNKLYERLFSAKHKWLAYFIIILVPVSLFIEGKDYHAYVSQNIGKSPNLFNLNQNSSDFVENVKSIDASQYQAILPFPFYYTGSENFGRPPACDKIYKLSFLYSYHLNMPMISSYLSRTSIYESKKIVQLLASNFYSKEIQMDLPNYKPFLVIALKDGLNEAENIYLKSATLISENEEYYLYEMPCDVFFKSNAESEYKHFSEVKNNLIEKSGFLVSDTSKFFTYIDFQSPDEKISFEVNNGCYVGLQKDYNIILSLKKGTLPLNRKYTARFWMYNNGENFGQDCLGGMIFFQKRNGDQVKWLDPIADARYSSEINGDWSLVEISFVNDDSEADYDLTVKGDDYSKLSYHIDDLLFYDSELQIYRVDREMHSYSLFHNNHRIKGSPNE